MKSMPHFIQLKKLTNVLINVSLPERIDILQGILMQIIHIFIDQWTWLGIQINDDQQKKGSQEFQIFHNEGTISVIKTSNYRINSENIIETTTNHYQISAL